MRIFVVHFSITWSSL